MTLPEHIGLGMFQLALIGFVWKLAKDNEEKEKKSSRRVESLTAAVEEKYVTKEICTVLHTQIQQDIQEIKSDLKLLLRKNGVHR